MNTPGADAAREQARQANGEFGTQQVAEANVELVLPTETAELPDGDGVGYLVTPGQIDDGAKAVYCSGPQSLALARQIHEQTGWPVIVTRRIGPDPELDESEWDDAEKFTALYEAHAEHPSGHLVTINGRDDRYSAGGSDFVDVWEYQRERVTDIEVLNELDDYCDTFPEEEWAATFVGPVLLANGHASARKPLTAPPSVNPKAAPFGQASTLKDLDEHFEALVSPENISWDGERSGAAVKAEQKRLNAAYWERRNEIDPNGERAFCSSCRQEVEGLSTGHPAEHENDLGRECWGGKQ